MQKVEGEYLLRRLQEKRGLYGGVPKYTREMWIGGSGGSMRFVKITTENEVSIVEKQLEEIKKEFGGFIERVRPRRLSQPYCLLIDESGLLKNLPINLYGSYLYETDKHGSPIVGDVYIAKEQFNEGNMETDIVGLSEEDCKKIIDIIITE